MLHRTNDRQGWAVRTAVIGLKSTVLPATRRIWLGGQHLPATGGCVVAVNHNSHYDPVTTAHYVYDHGRVPRFIAKKSLFHVPVVGQILGNAGQIPVDRQSRDAAGAFQSAVQAVRDGECVVVYPEGTLTRDPGLWPMAGKTGAARIALETRCPVVPVGQWGAQSFLAPYAKVPDVFPRKTVIMKAAAPVDLSDLHDLPRTTEVLRLATDRIMDAITAIVAELRGEPAPTERFDPRRAGVRLTGNPNDPRAAG